MQVITAETAQRGMAVWAIVEGKPYVCVIQEKGARSDSHKCMLRFASLQETRGLKQDTNGLRIGWRRYDQLLAYTGEALTVDEEEYLLAKAKEPDPLTPRQEVQFMAQELGFDFLQPAMEGYKPAAYFILCNFEKGEIEAFKADQVGYGTALVWMKTTAQVEPGTMPICENCNERTRTTCSKCGAGLCADCNTSLNMQDCPSGESQDDGLCWTCREKKAGTYIGD